MSARRSRTGTEDEASNLMPHALSSLMLPRLTTILSLAILAACSDSTGTAAPRHEAVITFEFTGNNETMKVLVTDSLTIHQAEQRIATGNGPRMPVGTIVRGAGVDARYPFRYEESSVRLADFAIEICDGSPMKTPAQVNQYFEWSTGNANAPRAPWCPWGATPIAVERR